MKGHQQVLNARKDGLRPEAVFVSIGQQIPEATNRFDDPEQAIDLGVYPTIFLGEEEAGMRADWRCLVGCNVHVAARQLTDQVLHTIEQIVEAGAAMVIGCATTDGAMVIYKNGKWSAHV